MFQKLVGIILVIYGLFKLFVGTTSIYASDKFKEKVSKTPPTILTKNIYVKDDTLAGLILEYIYIIFGLYTFLHGLGYLQLLTAGPAAFINSNQTAYLLYGILGVFSTLFYYLVVYTNVDISKDDGETNRYKLAGIFGGLLFLITIPLLLLYQQFTDNKLSAKDSITQMSMLSIIVIGSLMYLILRDAIPEKLNTVYATSLVMIPLNMA
jgi:hypothetical protein